MLSWFWEVYAGLSRGQDNVLYFTNIVLKEIKES